MPASNSDLIDRLKAAKEGSRELSDECLLAVGWTRSAPVKIHGRFTGDRIWHKPDGLICLPDRVPDPTRNVQDAIDWMVPEGWRLDELKNRGAFGWACQCWREAPLTPKTAYIGYNDGGHAATPALALCAAALKARSEI